MEDKRVAIAVFVCIAVFLVYQELVITPYTKRMEHAQSASAPQPTTSNTVAPSVAPLVKPPQNSPQNPAVDNQVVTSTNVIRPTLEQLKSAQKTKVETRYTTIEFNHLGARIDSLKLKEYKAELGSSSRYEMVTADSDLPLGVYISGNSDESVNYTVSSSEPILNDVVLVAEDRPLTLTFSGALPGGVGITKTVEISPESYLIGVAVSLSNPMGDRSNLWLEWSHQDTSTGTRPSWDFHGFSHFVDGKVGKVASNETPTTTQEVGLSPWVSFADKYFISSIINKDTNPAAVRLYRDGNIYIEQMAGGQQEGSFLIYAGPKEYGNLAVVGHDLERNVDLGWFAFLAYPLLLFIKFLYSVLGNYGLAIIVMTLSIKFLFLPLTKKSFVSMAAMQKLQPEMQSIRERFKSEPTRMNQEVMALYKRHKVNPMSGCLPIVIQIPVFLGLYNALQNSIDLRFAPFALWVHDLSSPEKLMIAGVGVPVMVIIMGALMFLQQWMTPSAMDPTQKKVMMIMPIVFTFMFVNFPAGLVLYWLTNNLISVVQQYYIRKNEMAFATRASVIASLMLFGFAYVLTLV